VALQRPDGFDLDIDFSIEPGQTVALLGPNGSGKSTTIDALAGLCGLRHGRVMLNDSILVDTDRRIELPPEARNLGVVFQRLHLFPHLTVRDNVAFGPTLARRRVRGLGRSSAAGEEAQRWLDLFGIAALADRLPGELSGGQAQRVALARALAGDPDALLLDEPLAAVDVAARDELRRTVRARLADWPGPRLLITHDPTDAFLLADQVVIIEDGRVTQRGRPDEIRRQPSTDYVAALAGVNLLTGKADQGVVRVDGSPVELRVADTTTRGPAFLTIAPNAVALHLDRPSGSPRNTWSTVVADTEPRGDVVRVTLGPPLTINVDVTPEATELLGLRPGCPIWASVKATEMAVHPV
jgi:molybdate transport system ATP-binding protein